MSTRSLSLKMIVSMALVALVYTGLASCGGGGSRPRGGDEMTIMPPTDNQPPQTSPDLVVESPTVSDSTPAPGASFTLSASARNAGDGESAATTLRYYRSVDGTITTSDTEVGTGHGGRACGFGERQPVGGIGRGRALGAQDVLLRGVCGRGGGGIGYGQQLLDSRADHGTVDGYADGYADGYSGRLRGHRSPRTWRWGHRR